MSTESANSNHTAETAPKERRGSVEHHDGKPLEKSEDGDPQASRKASGARPDMTSPVEAGASENGTREPMCTEKGSTEEPAIPPLPPVASMSRSKVPHTPTGKTRASEEFDRRYDGPFGRPSRTMRRSVSEMARRSQSRPRIKTGPSGDNEQHEMADVSDRDGATEGVFLPRPPSLNYTLHTRKMSIFLWWTVIVFDSVAMPIALYFGLWYGVGPGTNTPTEKNEKLSANAVFSIVTAAIGGASIFEYFIRFWRLWKDDSTCRVIGGKKWDLDWFHWNFTLAWLIVMIELVVGSVPDDPYIRLLATPCATMLYVFGTELLIVDILRYFRVPAPLRISSIPKGAQLRPGIYSLIEDIVAVDGSGGTAYREALDRRYEASHIFRAMLRRLGIFWAVGAQATAVLCTILIFTLQKDAAYTVGWTVPFVWAGIWAVITIYYVKRELRREEKQWIEDATGKQVA